MCTASFCVCEILFKFISIICQQLNETKNKRCLNPMFFYPHFDLVQFCLHCEIFLKIYENRPLVNI